MFAELTQELKDMLESMKATLMLLDPTVRYGERSSQDYTEVRLRGDEILLTFVCRPDGRFTVMCRKRHDSEKKTKRIVTVLDSRYIEEVTYLLLAEVVES